MTIRFGYCPPSPEPNSRLLKHVKWFNNIDDAVEAYDGHTSIWINSSGIYREITFEQLLNFQKDGHKTKNCAAPGRK
jgi:hypothetical protein